MLKLVKALDTDFRKVKILYDAYEDKKDLEDTSIKKAEEGKHKYFKHISIYDDKLYYLINDNDVDTIIGYGSIENSGIINYHSPFNNSGNISYGIRPDFRNRGYATKLLSLLLDICIEEDMDEVCISCLKNNIASKQVILKNGGKLETEFNYFGNEVGLKYWITLEKDKLKKKTLV